MFYIGIDPGKSGGIAIIDENKLTFCKCPKNNDDIGNLLIKLIFENEYFKCIKPSKSSINVIIEKVHAFPGKNSKKSKINGIVSTWTFAENYGYWQGVLSAFDIPFKRESPQKWMKHFGKFPKDRRERKDKLWEIAQSYFPDQKIYKYIADAVLLADRKSVV